MPLDLTEMRNLTPTKKRNKRPPKITVKRLRGKVPVSRLGKFWICKACARKVPIKPTIGPQDRARGYELPGKFICKECRNNANG